MRLYVGMISHVLRLTCIRVGIARQTTDITPEYHLGKRKSYRTRFCFAREFGEQSLRGCTDVCKAFLVTAVDVDVDLEVLCGES